jgi:dihydroorotate dehydrogenase (NAD+) catalytic subunit
MPADLRTRVGHLDLPSPILTASGCAGSGREIAQFTDVARIGAVITKSVTLEPRAGNPAPRMAETPSGLLSSVGLQGPGLDGFLQRDLPWLLSRGARAFVSVAGHTSREYGELSSRLSDSAGVTAIRTPRRPAARSRSTTPPPGRWWRPCAGPRGTTSRSSPNCPPR